jgi:hypothetical protein
MPNEPHSLVGWLANQSETIENQIKRALQSYAEGKLVGQWLMSHYGIGPVISAGLIAHIYMGEWCGFECTDKDGVVHHCRGRNKEDCERRQKDKKKKLRPHTFNPICSCPTVGHMWRFGGIDPTMKWEKGERRPWNAGLKTLYWKIGQSFMKFSGQDECIYGHMYQERKEFEVARNERGDNAERAKVILTQKKFKKDTEAYKAYIVGKLPPAHVDAQARRHAVKMFLSDLHTVMHFVRFDKAPPRPWVIDFGAHAHYRLPENVELIPGLREALAKRPPRRR